MKQDGGIQKWHQRKCRCAQQDLKHHHLAEMSASFVTAVSRVGKPSYCFQSFCYPVLTHCNSGNDRLQLKLGTSLETSDEQDFSGIRYHKVCWVNNVTNVQWQLLRTMTHRQAGKRLKQSFSNDRYQLKRRHDIDFARFTSGILMTVFLKQTKSMRPYGMQSKNT